MKLKNQSKYYLFINCLVQLVHLTNSYKKLLNKLMKIKNTPCELIEKSMQHLNVFLFK